MKVMLVVFCISITAVCVGLAGVSGDRIIDGNEAKSHSRPYMVFLEIKDGNSISCCGGFLILPNFILTAAHCNGQSITALLGAHDRSKNENSQQIISVMNRYPHENYNPSSLLNDIMLLKLIKNATITKEVQTISIAKTNQTNQNVTCSVAGWGRTATNGTCSKVLREVDVKIQTNCPSPLEICARGTGRKGFCKGDSGGPLVCPDDMNINTVVGIVSYYNKLTCEDPTRRNAYTRVFAYRDWIERKINTSSSA